MGHGVLIVPFMELKVMGADGEPTGETVLIVPFMELKSWCLSRSIPVRSS